MIRFNDLKPGDLVIAEYEGKKWEGVVKELNREDKRSLRGNLCTGILVYSRTFISYSVIR